VSSEQKQSTFDGWAIVDVLGHQRYVGYVTTEAYGQAVLFRIDVPALEERERVTKRPGYIGSDYYPAGTTVKEGAVEGYTKLIGSGSIYAITPCTKEAALKAVEDMQTRPLMLVQLPPDRALPPESPVHEPVDLGDDEEPDDDELDDEQDEDDEDVPHDDQMHAGDDSNGLEPETGR
jgi:hypothetical protein